MTNLPVTGSFSITATFGQTGSYWKNGHKGIDIYSDNYDIYATCNGTVRVVSYDDSGWGQYISIGDDKGYRHIFCHLKKGSVKVKPGDKVTPLTVIGTMGSTGNSTGIHLHYQVNDSNDNPVDPTKFIGVPNRKGTYKSEEFIILSEFKDEKKISPWAENAVKIVADEGIMVGDNDGYFRPKNYITREEVAVIIAKLLERK